MASIKQPVLLTLLGVVGYAFFLLITLPMSLALNWSDQLPDGISTYGVEGSIFNGDADALIWQNWRLDRLQWQFAPLQLLSGRIGYQLSFTNPDGRGSTIAAFGLGGSTRLEQLQLRLPMRWVSRQWSLPNHFGGELEVELAEFSIEDGRITAASGTLLWADAHLNGEPATALGSFRAELQPQQQDDGTHYRGPISDNGGPLNATGQFTLSADGLWQIRGKLALRETDHAAPGSPLGSLLNSLGAAGSDGKVDFTLQGQLPLPAASADNDAEQANAAPTNDNS